MESEFLDNIKNFIDKLITDTSGCLYFQDGIFVRDSVVLNLNYIKG